MKLLKTEDEDFLFVERVMYTKHYKLTLDKNRCINCELCEVTCPKEAIKITKPSDVKSLEQLSKKVIVTVLEDKCNFCGICSEICIFGAFKQSINGEENIPVLKSESFPRIIHEVEVDESKCPVGCRECEKACPLNLIKVDLEGNDPKGKVKVIIDKDYCPGCRICEAKCPYNAIHTRKIIVGSIKVNNSLCPDDCHACVDVCPIPGVLFASSDGKINVNDLFCVYCGACKNVCPVEGALELRRTFIHHTPVKSGAWNKALERLTSTGDMAKELRSKSMYRTYDSVRRLQIGGRVKK